MLKSLREFAQSTDFLLLARCLLAEVPRHYFPSVAALHDMRRLRNHPNGRIVDLDAYATHRWLVDGRGWYAVKNALMVITYALPTSRQSAILPAPRNPELLRLGGGSGAVAYSALIRGFRRDKVVPQSFVADTNARVVNLLDKALSAHSSSALSASTWKGYTPYQRVIAAESLQCVLNKIYGHAYGVEPLGRRDAPAKRSASERRGATKAEAKRRRQGR